MTISKHDVFLVVIWLLIGLSIYGGLRRELILNRQETALNREYAERIERAVQRLENSASKKP